MTFLIEYCGWTNGQRVSLPHVRTLLHKATSEKRPKYERIEREIESRLEVWQGIGCIELESDPFYCEIEHLWPTKLDGNGVVQPELIDGLGLIDMRHAVLLYKVRCSLVHEFRGQVASGNLSNPSCYWPENAEWRLIYSVTQIAELCKVGVVRLEERLRRDRESPMDSFSIGLFLNMRLNKPPQREVH